jgi:hypothetical protein
VKVRATDKFAFKLTAEPLVEIAKGSGGGAEISSAEAFSSTAGRPSDCRAKLLLGPMRLVLARGELQLDSFGELSWLHSEEYWQFTV